MSFNKIIEESKTPNNTPEQNRKDTVTSPGSTSWYSVGTHFSGRLSALSLSSSPFNGYYPSSPNSVSSPVKVVSFEELNKHNTPADLWVSVNGSVYDVTSFIDKHPGLRGPFINYAGKDASDGFNKVHKNVDAVSILGLQNYMGILIGHETPRQDETEWVNKTDQFKLV